MAMDHSPHGWIPTVGELSAPDSPPSTLRCCCGRPDCVYLQHNHATLQVLENDLATAAKLGQALLYRHEAYIAEAEENRARLRGDMDSLEHDNHEAQEENNRIVRENHSLLDELEGLNSAVAASDAQIKILTDRLERTQLEMQELAISAARASELEVQLTAMESEQLQLQQELIHTQEDEKSAVQRWKRAECTLQGLHDQLDRLEHEAQEERERHVEMIQGLERRRVVERELDGAAGRLKGAAASRAIDFNKSGSNVVSSFVRDILQDNATLQMGIVELRGMLESSNQEVQNLREQISIYQPVAVEIADDQPQSKIRLSEELESRFPSRISQEFHVHHHYHSASSSVSTKKDKIRFNRRPKKKRLAANDLQTMQSTASSQAPGTPVHRRVHRPNSSASSILSQTSVTIPTVPQRWSLHSPGASSLASSPQSAYRPSSIFDMIDYGIDSSRPTSPESIGFSSPSSVRRQKILSDVPLRSSSGPPAFQRPTFLPFQEEIRPGPHEDEDLAQIEGNTGISDDRWLPPAIPEEQEDQSTGCATEILAAEDAEVAPGQPTNDGDTVSALQCPSLRRPVSHESLLSVSGVDIHEHPSQLLLSFGSRYLDRVPKRIMSPGTELSSTPPVISTTTITVDKASLSSTLSKSPHSLLASVAACGGPSAATTDVSARDNGSNVSSPALAPRRTSIGQRVGGWVFGRWGMAPTPSLEDLRSQSDVSSSTELSRPSTAATATSTKLKPHDPKPRIPRIPGVNQRGPIPGLQPRPTAISLHPAQLDHGLLEESLKD